jgi:2',3'-cyclic-nucleotide 2'-phosphodiesterase/3'-nucleotidase/5'-nucleotidase
MPKRLPIYLLVSLFFLAAALPAEGTEVRLKRLWSYRTNIFNKSAAEIVAYDPGSQRLFVTNAARGTIDVLKLWPDAETGAKLGFFDIRALGGNPNSVAAKDGLVAVAAENAEDKTLPGEVIFFDAGTDFSPGIPPAALHSVTVGSLPDMLAFTPDGRAVLTANEGEAEGYGKDLRDPEGSVSIIDISPGLDKATAKTAAFRAFDKESLLKAGVRIFGPGASAAQDLEPEYIAVAPDNSTAYVCLQENNALAVVDIAAAKVTAILPLGCKDHSLPGNGLDASDKDHAVNIANWPVRGMYQPDGIAVYDVQGDLYLVTANEGDFRNDLGDGPEDVRIADLNLDPRSFPDAAKLKSKHNLGRLKVTRTLGRDAHGVYQQLYSFGARSFSIWSLGDKNAPRLRQVYDSGEDFERRTAAAFARNFNANNDDNKFDERSDDRGPEPEGIALGSIDGRVYAFIGLERIGGVMVYDVTDPRHARFATYVNNRDFSGDPQKGTAADLGPEGLLFISAGENAKGKNLLIVANEVSGSVTAYEVLVSADR